jgi:hypothetical protein
MANSTRWSLAALTFSFAMLLFSLSPGWASESACWREAYCVNQDWPNPGVCVISDGAPIGCDDGPFCLGYDCCNC